MQGTLPVASVSFFCAYAALTLACGGETSTPGDAVKDADAAPIARPDAGDHVVAVPACQGTTPFESEACGVGLQERCRAFDNERDCSAAAGVVLADGQYDFPCGWAKVTKFSAVASCSVESTFGRCESYIVQQVGCNDPCGPFTGGLYDSLMASVERSELVKNPCGSGRVFAGPIGRGVALANQQTDAREWQPCGTDISPPPPAELCACVATACAQ